MEEKKIGLKYKVIESDENEIRIFGKDFVKNNKEKCKIELNGNIKELCEFYKK